MSEIVNENNAENQNQQNNNNQEQSGDKIQKNYDNILKKLVAVVGGKEKLLPQKKIGKDLVATVVEGLMKEKKENLVKEVKDDLNNLLTKNIEVNKAVTEKQKELDNLKKQKQKEFTEAANKVFEKIDNLGELEQEYYQALGNAAQQ